MQHLPEFLSGRYRVLAAVGQGTTATVYEGREVPRGGEPERVEFPQPA